jgi:hypothetical protein
MIDENIDFFFIIFEKEQKQILKRKSLEELDQRRKRHKKQKQFDKLLQKLLSKVKISKDELDNLISIDLCGNTSSLAYLLGSLPCNHIPLLYKACFFSKAKINKWEYKFKKLK